MFRKKLIVFLLLTGFSGVINAQECSVKLRNAENLFNAGLVEEVPALLEACLRNGFTRAEEYSAYQTLIRSYLFEDKIDIAGQTMFGFLKKNPEYEVRPTDNADFVYLMKKFKVKPVVQISIKGSANLSFISVVEGSSLSGDPLNGKYSNSSATYGIGLGARFKINNKIEVGGSVDYSQLGFKYTETILDFTQVNYSEKQQRLEIPLELFYSPKQFGLFHPYVKAGAGLALNFRTMAVVNTQNIDINNAVPHTGEPENRNPARNFADPLVVAGLGCKFKLPMSYLFIDISTHLGVRNQTILEEPSNLPYHYFYTDDFFRINSLKFSMGFIYIIYKPEKLEN